MQLPEEPEYKPHIDILPAIDVIFAVLVFFILATLFLSENEGLPVDLPAARTGETVRSLLPERITVSITSSGKLALDGEPIALPALEKKVRSLAASDTSLLAVISADKTVTHGRVVQVMDRLRSVPGVRLAIATEQP